MENHDSTSFSAIRAGVEYVLSREYGEVIRHEDLANVMRMSLASPEDWGNYYRAIVSVKKQTARNGKVVVNSWSHGYRIIVPDEYNSNHVKTHVSLERKLLRAKLDLFFAPKSLMNRKNRKVHKEFCAFLDAYILEAKKRTNALNKML